MTIQKYVVRNSPPRAAGSHPEFILLHGTRRSADEIAASFSLARGNIPHYLVCEDASIRQYIELQNRSALDDSPDNSVSLLFCTGSTGRISDAQLEVAVRLLRAVREQCRAMFRVAPELNASVIRMHRHLAKGVDCPGPQFPYDALLARLLPPPVPHFRARLDPAFTRRAASEQAEELKKLGFKTAAAEESNGVWVVHMALHAERAAAEDTVRVLRRLGKKASVEKVLLPAGGKSE